MNRRFEMSRRRFFAVSAAALLAGPAFAARDVIDVYKSATCGCCGKWIEHLRANGFEVRAHDVPESAEYRGRYGVPDNLGSCHTATVAGYAIEGHVPAREIRRLLVERPKMQGLAVPGMPKGSPGMEGSGSDPYDVLLFQRDGRYTTYARYGR
jgi:hypothetical protein